MLLFLAPILLNHLFMIKTNAQVGVCHTTNGNNLLSPRDVANLYKSNGIRAMRIYGPDQAILRALKGTPLKPGQDIESYLYAMFGANKKPSESTQQNFGIYTADGRLCFNSEPGKTPPIVAQERATLGRKLQASMESYASTKTHGKSKSRAPPTIAVPPIIGYVFMWPNESSETTPPPPSPPPPMRYVFPSPNGPPETTPVAPPVAAPKLASPPSIEVPKRATQAPTIAVPQRATPSSKMTKKLELIPVFAVAISIVFFMCLGVWLYRKKMKNKDAKKAKNEGIRTMESSEFDIDTIKMATNNFSEDNKLGEGGFGEVFKGTLENGQQVAVKRLLQNSKQGVTEFYTEVALVAKLQHKNLVKLLGFCMTSREKILVYEFLPNSSLDKFLFDPTNEATLEWKRRFSIIIGIAKGLMYLHEDSRLTVVHRDLKTSNILLDGAMNPKIADFGLAKLFEEDQTHCATKRIVGTYGYMAPEYAITGYYSVKSDAYSFGVIVLEIISGKRNRFFGGMNHEEALLHQAWRLWIENKALDIVDSRLNNVFQRDQVTRCFHIGLLCIQEDAIRRPTMRSILEALSNPTIRVPDPSPPRFFGNPSNLEGQHSPPYIYTGTQMITGLYSRD